MGRYFSDDLQMIWGKKRSPLLSTFLTALNRRQSKNSLQIRFNEQRRVVVYGSAKVGKSTIINQFLYDTFLSRYRRTIEDLHVADYNLSTGASLTLEILDTNGDNEFPPMRRLSLAHGDAFLLVFSTNDEESWEEVKSLRKQIIEARNDVPIVVAANKININGNECPVNWEIVDDEIKQWNCGYVECNAKENTNIVDVFEEILNQSNIEYDLNEAVTRRRQSMPAMPIKSRSRSKTRINF